MGHAYTPGLKVTERQLVVKKRILPLKGEVLVKVGDKVKPDDVVARTFLPGPVEPLNVANLLGCLAEDVPAHMLKKQGEKVQEGEVIAKSKTFFGLFTSTCKTKMTGSIESVSHITGQVLIRGTPLPVEVKAYIDGEVVQIFEKEGVEVASWGSFIQGIFGVGGETHGEIKLAVSSPEEVLSDQQIDASCGGKVIVGGSMVTSSAINKAISVKAKGIVVGGIDDKDLRDFLGYDLGVAITGSEDKGISLVITEGFGHINMAGRTFNLLKSKEGKLACLNGATQIRAGVLRPEVIVPAAGDVKTGLEKIESENAGLEVGSPVRVIRQPYFGLLGKISQLPPQLQKLETESSARILEVEFSDGKKAIVPRANVEMIES